MQHIQQIGNAVIDNLSRAVAGDRSKFTLITAALLAGGGGAWYVIMRKKKMGEVSPSEDSTSPSDNTPET